MKNKFSKNVNEKDIIYIVMSVWIFIMIYYKSMMETFSEFFGKTILFIRILLVFLAFTNCLINRQNKKKVILLVAFTLIVVLDYIFADNWLIFELFFITFFWGDKLDYKKVLKIFCVVIITSMIFVVFMNRMGLSPVEFVYIRPSGRRRLTIGFNHPNALSECMMSFLFCLYLLNNKGLKKRVIAFVMVVSAVFIFVFPNTNYVAGVIILVLVFDILLRGLFHFLRTKRQKKVLFVGILFFTFFLFVLVYYVVLTKRFDNSNIFHMFDTLYHRVILSRKGLERYGISLFGTYYESTTDIQIYVKKTATEYFTIDCLYFLLPIRYGLIATIVFFTFYLKSIYSCILKNNIELLSIFLVGLIMGIVSPFITLFTMNYLFICAKCYKSGSEVIKNSDFNKIEGEKICL